MPIDANGYQHSTIFADERVAEIMDGMFLTMLDERSALPHVWSR
jgi:hypothetical protein